VPEGVRVENLEALPWTDASLNQPSSAPLQEFYVYRAVSEEKYPPLNTNVGSLAGVLWYLHHEVVIQSPRKFNIKRILRYKVRMRATEPLVKLGMHFGVRFAFDKGQATGPFVCGREKVGSGWAPKFCGDAFNKKNLVDMKPYKAAYEWSAFGYHVGCNNLGEYPFPMDTVYYPEAIWYSLPGICPDKLFNEEGPACKVSEPGGYCPGIEPTGNGTCTWNYENAGEISIDELVGIKDYDSWRHSHREYNPLTDRGTGFSWWDGLNSTTANAERLSQAEALFDKRYPDSASQASMKPPPCDFKFGPYYRTWYRKDGYSGPCGTPSAKCKGSIAWIKSTGMKTHPEWYIPLDADATDNDLQRLLYEQGKGGCLRPCSTSEAML